MAIALTYKLEHNALDWAVAKYETANKAVDIVLANGADSKPYFYIQPKNSLISGTPLLMRASTEESQGVAIIHREKIAIEPVCDGWHAHLVSDDGQGFMGFGPTPLVAAMRCFVASRHKDLMIEIPDQFMEPGFNNGYVLDPASNHQATPEDAPTPASDFVFDLDQIAWEDIKAAAAESSWMPENYTRNDWISDVCDFLRKGPEQFHNTPASGIDQQKKLREARQAAAEAAFAAHDFGDAEVTDADGWTYTNPGTSLTRTIYINGNGDASERATFSVLFYDVSSAEISEVYAIDKKGQFIGQFENNSNRLRCTPS